MQGIYIYIPETNCVPREYSVAAVLLLLFMVLISLVSMLNLLYFYISTFRSTCAVPSMAFFWISFTTCFPGMLLTYFLNDFEIVPVTHVITGITFVFTFHMRCISIVRTLYFRIFSASFFITFLSPETATSINIHVPFSLARIIMSGLSLEIVLSVCTCLFHNMVTLSPWLVSTNSGTCSYQCSCAHTLSCLFMYCSFAGIGHAYIMWSIVSSNCWQNLHLLSVSVLNIFVA